MELRVLGCGDAFGSGGRMQTCFHVAAGSGAFLIDCGATALIAMRRHGIDPNGIGTILLSHLHGDHFGGLPFLILDAQLVSRRTAPLTVVGPPGLAARLSALMEAMFPGSATARRRFALEIVEYTPGKTAEVNGITLTPFEVRHPSGAPTCALRIAVGGRILAYTGDTEWVEALIPAAQGADLLIAEAYTPEKPVPFHLDWATLRARLPEIGARRVLLTHMGPDMLAHAAEGCEKAGDGMRIALG
ncbi:MAG: MBL fold metallo-hydrolase [Gemmobacter sp.]